MRVFLVTLLLLPFAAFGQGSTRTYDTVEIMTNQSPSIISTSGKVTVDVRGTSGHPGGVFYWDAAASAPVDELTYFPALGSGRWVRASYWISDTNAVGGGGGSTVYVSSVLFTNLNLVEGANISLTPSGTNVTISGITSTNSGTVVTVDGGSPLVIANFADSPEVNQTVAGSNVTANLVNGSITTNKVDAIFYNLLTTTGSTGAVVRVNAGASIPDASFDTSSFIGFGESGGSITATVVNGSISTNKLDSTVYNLLISGGGTGSVVRVNAGASIPDASFDSSSFILFNNSAGSITATVANASLTTNLINTAFYNLLVGGGGTGTVVSVNAGPALPTASFDSSSFISFSESSGSVTASVVNGSIGTNKLDTQVYNLLIAGGVTDLEGLTDVDLGTPASSQVITYNGTVWTNSTPAAGGGGGSGTNIFVGASTLVQPAHLTGSANATWSVENSTNVVVTFTGVGSATNGYLVKSVTAVTNIGGAGEIEHMNVTIPGDTLSEDGDELIFHVPGFYGNYLNAADEHLTWYAYWADAPQILASYNLTNTVANTSTERAVVWEIRLKRLSSTRFLAWTEFKIGWGSAEEAQNPIESFRVSSLTVDMGGFTFADDLTFALAAEHSANSISADTLVTYGYTVLKPGSAGGSGSGGSSTRTGVARTLNWPANTFTPSLTEPATAFTNTWATATDRYAQECWQFSSTTTNGIRADFIFPNTYSNSTPVNVRFWMKQLAAEATSTNSFAIKVGSHGSGDTGGALLGTAVIVTVVGANNTNQLTQSSWSGDITVGNTPSAGNKGIITIDRLPGHTSDNGSVAVVITDIEMEYLEHDVEPSNN